MGQNSNKQQSDWIYNNQRQETKWVFGQSPKTKATPTDGDSEDDMPVKKARKKQQVLIH